MLQYSFATHLAPRYSCFEKEDDAAVATATENIS